MIVELAISSSRHISTNPELLVGKGGKLGAKDAKLKFDQLDRSIARLKEILLTTGFPIDVKISGILILVSDFEQLGRAYKQSLSRQLARLALERKVRIRALFVDIRDIDFQYRG